MTRMTRIYLKTLSLLERKSGRGVLLSCAFFILVFIDQFTKFYASHVFHNFVFAFSLPLPLPLIYLIYIFVVGAMIMYCARNLKHFTLRQSFAWTLIFAGAASNIFERILLGYVRDWIYIFTGVFNLADGYIILGIILLLNLKFEYRNPKQISNSNF